MSSEATSIKPPKQLVITSDKMASQWKLWLQQFEWFATATQLQNKSPEVQAATFMASLGTDAAILFNTFGLTSQESIDVATLKARFTNHFAPTPNESYVRLQFNNLKQQEGESFDEFITTAKTQIRDCEYGSLTDSILRDKIVFGVRCEAVRQKLLEEEHLTLQKAIQMCKASEQATRQLQEINNTKQAMVETVQKVDYRNKKQKKYPDTFNCGRCGTEHEQRNCPAYKQRCTKCKRAGHFTALCRARYTTQNDRQIHEATTESHTDEVEMLYVDSIAQRDSKVNHERDWMETITVQDKLQLTVKLDTGAQCNVISKEIADKIKAPIKPSATKNLITYSKNVMRVCGEIIASCRVRNRPAQIRFLVVEEKVKPLLGKKACETLNLVQRVESVIKQPQTPSDNIILEEIFKGLGCVTGYEYEIDLEDDPTFRIHPPRKIPHAIRDEVKKELDNMEQLGVIRRVSEPTPVVSPLVIIKKNGKLRPCIDPSDLNKYVKRRHYPLQTIEEIAARIRGAKYFTKLDCNKGFWQVKVSENTTKYLTINTPWGRYSFLRVPFGLKSAPEIFQELMTNILQDIKQVEISMDDVLIYAETRSELKQITNTVLRRLHGAGMRLNKEKCKFEAVTVTFLGHILSGEGLKPDPEKIRAINLLKTPTNLTELQRFMGMVTYLAKFIPGYSTITEPLRALTNKDIEWHWGDEQKKAVAELKLVLQTPPVLAYYDVRKPVTISVDASSTAVGAVLLQEKKPVAYATKSLTETQKRYPQIEKEAFAIRFGCNKFHDYIYGKDLEIETDHKPLEAISKKPLASAPPRLQRIFFDLAQYAPKIKYVKGKDIPIADTLSRDCEPTQEDESPKELEVNLVVPMSQTAVEELRQCTSEDSELSELKLIIIKGWPKNPEDLAQTVKQYWNYREELSIYDEVIFKNWKPVIPAALKNKYLQAVHEGHMGILSSIRRAREAIFWRGLSRDITEYVQACSICQRSQRANDTEPIQTKQIPQRPWEIVASDLLEYRHKHYILITDSYSGFFDFVELSQQDSATVIKELKKWFAVHGSPVVLETDNGPQYTSKDFRHFVQSWEIDHRTSSPHFPRANGLAERSVQTTKNLLRKCWQDGTDIYKAILNIRNTPRSLELGSPVQRLFSRRTRTAIPTTKLLLKPKVETNVAEALQATRRKQKEYADKRTRPSRPIEPGQQIRIQQGHRDWIGGTLIQPTKYPRSYIVKTEEGKELRRNLHHIKETHATIPNHRVIVPRTTELTEPSKTGTEVQPEVKPENPPVQLNRHSESPGVITTRAGRVVRPPMKLDL